MCTLVLLIRPGHDWPMMLAANRDERVDRPWDPPAAWWPDRPDVVGGRDRSGGGTWLAMNGQGVVSAVLNRPGSLGPALGKRSRGELPLLALAYGSADAAVAALVDLDAGAWRSFNLVVADRMGAFFLRGRGRGAPQAERLGEGITMLTAHDPNDEESPRIARHLPRFREAIPPDRDDWAGWRALLSDRGGGPGEAINIEPVAGFGTISSSLIGLPRLGPPQWLFCAGRPDEAPFVPVPLVGEQFK